MEPRASYRGGPLFALSAVLCIWIAARIVLAPYDSPFRYVEAVSSPRLDAPIAEAPALKSDVQGHSVAHPTQIASSGARAFVLAHPSRIPARTYLGNCRCISLVGESVHGAAIVATARFVRRGIGRAWIAMDRRRIRTRTCPTA